MIDPMTCKRPVYATPVGHCRRFAISNADMPIPPSIVISFQGLLNVRGHVQRVTGHANKKKEVDPNEAKHVRLDRHPMQVCARIIREVCLWVDA